MYYTKRAYIKPSYTKETLDRWEEQERKNKEFAKKNIQTKQQKFMK